MPELPDVTVYLEALEARILGARLLGLRLANPFVLRSVDPPPSEVAGREVTGLRRLGGNARFASPSHRSSRSAASSTSATSK
jgi:formamidopyrimidine-DNA glycosylase